MSPEGRVQVFVRSRKVPVRRIAIQRPVYSSSGLIVGTQIHYAIVYDTALDYSHQRAIEEARKLSCNLGLDLEVIDRTAANPLRRLVSAVRGGRTPQPILSLSPPSSTTAA
jgi:hypothetical protein